MDLSIIVAVARNGIIGRDGALPWRLSDDLRRFKRLTMGHHIVMGRRTYESIGRPLPGRQMIVLSRTADYAADAAAVAHDLDDALAQAADDDEVFVIGGASLYELALPRATRLYLTSVEADVPGDTVLTPIDLSAWQLVEETAHPADERNDYPTTFRVHERA